MKNPFTVLILTLFLLNSALVFAETKPDEFTPVYAKALADNVNIRAGQGPNFEVIGRLRRGAEVVVIGERYDWYKINLPKEAACYVHKDYIKDGEVAAGRLRVRAGAGANFNVLGILEKGEAIEVLKEEGDWLRIAPPETCAGWIQKEYLGLSQKRFVREIARPPVLAQKRQKITEARGAVRDLGKIINRQGTHKLVDDKKVLYYLKSEGIDLNLYVYQNVRVKGELIQFKHSEYPVIDVQEIQVEQ